MRKKLVFLIAAIVLGVVIFALAYPMATGGNSALAGY